MTPAEAQTRANFAVLLPGRLPADCRADLEGASLREEKAPGPTGSSWCKAHTSSYSILIGGTNRALRCKQFLYDLGPLSTLDHAALYDHFLWELRPIPRPDGRVIWVGFDYAKKRAASFLGWGTNVELRTLEGSFTDDELVEIAEGLEPTPGAGRPLSLSFAKLSYWSRYPRYDLNLCVGSYRPPSSLWKLRFPWFSGDHEWSDSPDGATSALRGWRLDSRCRFGDASSPAELQALYFPEDGRRHHQAWLRVLDAAASPLKKPAESRLPEIETFSGFSGFPITVLTAKSGPVFCASVTRAHGPHDALWWEGNHLKLFHVSSGSGHDFKGFFKPLLNTFFASPPQGPVDKSFMTQ